MGYNEIMIPPICYVAEQFQNAFGSRIVIRERQEYQTLSVLELRNKLNSMILNGDCDFKIQYKIFY